MIVAVHPDESALRRVSRPNSVHKNARNNERCAESSHRGTCRIAGRPQRAAILHGGGGTDENHPTAVVLKSKGLENMHVLEDFPRPSEPKGKEVLVHVKAAAINP